MIFNMTEDEWDAVIAVHLKGTFNTIRAASVSMREQKGGRIISMSSVSALGAPGQPNYAAAKAGIIGLTWSTANAMAKYGVTVQRDHAERRHPHDRLDAARPRRSSSRPASGRASRRSGTERDPDNVAPLVVYLSSDAAANVNGQVFHSFGYGYTLLAQPQAVAPPRAPAAAWTRRSWRSSSRRRSAATSRRRRASSFGRTLDERPAGEWKDLGGGVRLLEVAGGRSA